MVDHNIIQPQITRKWYKIKLYLNGTIFSDHERPQTQISRLGYSSTLNVSEMAKDTAIVATECE